MKNLSTTQHPAGTRRNFIASAAALALPAGMRQTMAPLAATGAVFLAGRANALSLLLLTILPTVAAGLLGLLGIRMQLRQEEARRLEDRASSREQLRFEHARLQQQINMAARSDRIAIATTLLQMDEDLRKTFVSANLGWLQSVVVDRETKMAAHGTVLSENFDGIGTRVGFDQGRLVVERGGQNALLNNQVAADVATYMSDGRGGQIPVPVAVEGVIRDLNKGMTRAHQQLFAVQQGISADEAEKQWSLAGEQRYSRARRPRGAPDILVATFLPRKPGASVRNAYVIV